MYHIHSKGDKMNTFDIIRVIAMSEPTAIAHIQGSDVNGKFLAFPYSTGSIVVACADGLPDTGCHLGIHGFHIHEGTSCATQDGKPFGASGGHLNLTGCQHPYHTGDLPPLFSDEGKAWMAVYTSRFTPEEVIGRTVIIHSHADDFVSQPAGDSGNKIACGVIMAPY